MHGHTGYTFALAMLAFGVVLAAQSGDPPPAEDPLPATPDEFRARVEQILAETGVPGAGIALVRHDGIEWAGGIGDADRERRTPISQDTHFRVGSISKTFVAMALVQLSEDGTLDLDATLEELAPELEIVNPWHDTDPVRVIHVLQHTAGFDEMHFNERYNESGPPDMPPQDVLRINPNSRRVRWKPGTRMSYANPGYTVAAYLLEKLTGEPFEDYIKREIFDPLEMHTSSFRLTRADEEILARGYAHPGGPRVGYDQIYHRASGNMHSSPREMGRFVQMLLGWGELGDAFVIDPEYLSNMEHPRTTLAAAAGLRSGYGTGIFAMLTLPYPMLGHDGGIEGFSSIYAYSPGRDVGYVVLLNSSDAAPAMRRISSLALRYLKRDVEPPVKPEVAVDPAALQALTGFYMEANPRSQIAWPLQWLSAGRTVRIENGQLIVDPLLDEAQRLVPVSSTAFRLQHAVDATHVFLTDPEGRLVLAGMQLYAERVPRWTVEIVRVPVIASIPVIFSPLVVAAVWLTRIRRARPRGFWDLKIACVACPMALAAPFSALALISAREWGARNAATVTVFAATLAVPALAAAVAVLAVGAWRAGGSRLLVSYCVLVALATAIVSLYLASHGLVGLRLWTY